MAIAVQVSAANTARYTPPIAAVPAGSSAQIADLTQLAVAQTNVKITASAGAALGQAASDLTGALVDISA